jgi:hypothetical protein
VDAIAGVQEAPPDKMEAITSLRALLLGKEPPLEPVAPPMPPVVAPRIDESKDDGPTLIMWDPTAVHRVRVHKMAPPTLRAASPNPAFIEDDINNAITNWDAPPHPSSFDAPLQATMCARCMPGPSRAANYARARPT